MADKKITIKPGDMERLQELMRQEEERLDAANPSDAELAQWERRLDESVRKLAQKTPDTLPLHSQEMDRNWAALQDKLKHAPQAAQETPGGADVLPMTRRPSKTLPFLGLLAAAALVFIMVRPPASDDSVVMNDQNVQIKGPAGSASKADCELDVAPLDKSIVAPASNGQGFLGSAGANVEISFRCSHSGFMRADIEGPRSLTLITPVTHGERQRILRKGEIVRLTLQSRRPWSISLILMDKELSTRPVPKDHILWQDKISVGARE